MGRAKQSKPYVLGTLPGVCQYARATWLCIQPSMPFRPASFNLPAAFQRLGNSQGLELHSISLMPIVFVQTHCTATLTSNSQTPTLNELSFCLKHHSLGLNQCHKMSLEIADWNLYPYAIDRHFDWQAVFILKPAVPGFCDSGLRGYRLTLFAAGFNFYLGRL